MSSQGKNNKSFLKLYYITFLFTLRKEETTFSIVLYVGGFGKNGGIAVLLLLPLLFQCAAKALGETPEHNGNSAYTTLALFVIASDV